MKFKKWLYMQLFAGEGEGAGTATGESAVDPGQQRLRELGVPEDKIRRRAKKPVATPPPAAAPAAATEPEQPQEQEQAAAADTPEERPTEKARMSWQEIMADPEYNREMQATIQARLRSAKGAEEDMKALAPALEVLARKYKMDPEKIDPQALAKAINEDGSYYEDIALKMGVSAETAMKVDQQERDNARQQREQARTLEEQRIQSHIRNMEQQSEAMKKVFPDFDLRKELQNPTFARMTSPNVGISVEDAYHAVHRKEIQSAAMQVTAQKTAQKISNAIQSGSQRPKENGTTGQAPSETKFDYRAATPEQRADFKKFLRSEAAQGRKVYPGSYT